jgi:ABC-2 type transport system permease protein
MKVLLILIIKEFKQIFRNRFMLPIIFVVPLVQMLILVYSASLEMKNIKMVVVDQDLSTSSRRLTTKFTGSPFFQMLGYEDEMVVSEDFMAKGKADVILRFQKGFEKRLITESESDIQLIINAINATEAGLISNYCSRIIIDFNNRIRTEWLGRETLKGGVGLEFIPKFWYNDQMDYKIYMFPGILVIIVTLIGLLLTALNLVREKEMGTTEQVNVTPIRKYQFIVAKLLPFWIIAMFELALGLVIGRILFDLPIVGKLSLLFGFASVYLIVVLGIGLFLSTISNTQQQLMFVAFFFMITFILMSGVFTPAESMPGWAQKINYLNPMAYFMRVNRMVLLKGSIFADISREFYGLTIYAVLILTLAIVNYRKTS